MSYTGDGVAQTQAFAHARKQLGTNAKIAQLEGFTTRIPTDGDVHVSVFAQVRGATTLWSKPMRRAELIADRRPRSTTSTRASVLARAVRLA